MKKRFLICILVLGLLATSAVAAGGMRQLTVTEDTGISVTLNGEKQELKDANGNPVYTMVHEGTTYLPVRAVCGLAGLEVNWNDETRTVELGKSVESDDVSGEIGNTFAVKPEDWQFGYANSNVSFVTADPDMCTVAGQKYDWSIVSKGLYSSAGLHFGSLQNMNEAKYLHFKVMCPSDNVTIRLFSDSERKTMCLREFTACANDVIEMDIDVKNATELYFFATFDGNTWDTTPMTMVDMYFHN